MFDRDNVQLEEDIAQLKKQVKFVVGLWAHGDENAAKMHTAVSANAKRVKTAIMAVPSKPSRDWYLEDLGASINRLHDMKRQGFHIEGSGPVHPSKFFGKVRSVRLAGPPGSGKRR